jgi:hypothetical protein
MAWRNDNGISVSISKENELKCGEIASSWRQRNGENGGINEIIIENGNNAESGEMAHV